VFSRAEICFFSNDLQTQVTETVTKFRGNVVTLFRRQAYIAAMALRHIADFTLKRRLTTAAKLYFMLAHNKRTDQPKIIHSLVLLSFMIW
jgi:hypothetical protein